METFYGLHVRSTRDVENERRPLGMMLAFCKTSTGLKKKHDEKSLEWSPFISTRRERRKSAQYLRLKKRSFKI